MRIGIISVFVFCFAFTVKSQTQIQDLSFCNIVEKIFLENIFYTTSLDLSFVDTITILDMTNQRKYCKSNFSIRLDSTLYKCNEYEGKKYKSNLEKTVVFITQDVIPYPLIGSWSNDKRYSKKYQNYFILQSFEEIGNLKLLKLFKVLSNHKIILSYKYLNRKIELIDFEVGQY